LRRPDIKGRLEVFENRMLKRISGPERDEVTEEWRDYSVGSFKICADHQI
jgi:hypothetical protein